MYTGLEEQVFKYGNRNIIGDGELSLCSMGMVETVKIVSSLEKSLNLAVHVFRHTKVI